MGSTNAIRDIVAKEIEVWELLKEERGLSQQEREPRGETLGFGIRHFPLRYLDRHNTMCTGMGYRLDTG